MEYDVILSAEAQEHFRKIIHYLIYELQSDQAAIRVTDDMEETIAKLSDVAGSLKLCEHPRLRDLGIGQSISGGISILCCIKLQAVKRTSSGSSMTCRIMKTYFRLKSRQS